MDLKEFKESFYKWIEELKTEKEKQLNTIKTYSNAVNSFIGFLEAQGNTDINKASVLDYKKELVRQKEEGLIKTSTVNSRITVLNKLFKDIGLETLTMKRLKVQAKTSNNDVISESDYNRLIRWADKLGMDREKLIMQTLTGTGIRINELQFFTVEALKNNRDSLKVVNKNKEREIIVPDKVRKALLNYARKNNIKTGIIFHSSIDREKMLDKAWIWRKLKYIAGKARVKKSKVHAHSFRHLFAQRYLKLYPQDITNLADLLGHSSLETTRIYARLQSKEQKNRANKMFEQR